MASLGSGDGGGKGNLGSQLATLSFWVFAHLPQAPASEVLPAGCTLKPALPLTQGWPRARVQQLFVDWLRELVDAQGFHSRKSSRPALGALLLAIHRGSI